MKLGIFLKRFRKEVSLSGNSLAKRIGVSRYSLEKWENAGSLPNCQSALKVQGYFGIESLIYISEEKLDECIARELKRFSIKEALMENEKENENHNKEIFTYLNLLNERLTLIEKIVKKHKEQLKNLEGLFLTKNIKSKQSL